MASGFFPLDDADGKRLSEIAAEIDAIRDDWADAVRSSCTPEDAMYDGGYLERLSIAAGYIRGCLKQ